MVEKPTRTTRSKKAGVRGPIMTVQQEQLIHEWYPKLGNIAQTARQAGVSYAACRKYYQEHETELQAARNKHAVDIVPTMEMVRRLALEELLNPARLAKARTHELSIIIGILTDKINVIMGQPTTRVAVQHVARSVVEQFSPEEREKIRQLRDKMLSDGTPREIVDGIASVIE